MSFLAPWFLLGGLAIAGPILFHLIRRVVRDRVPFSSLLFLRPTPPKVTRRRRIEHFWLLLLRCLCLLLLAAAFARPFFFNQAALPLVSDEGRQLLLLIDTSASMQREGLWEKARAVAAGYLDKTAPADQVAIVAFDRQATGLVSFSEWNSWGIDERAALARERLGRLEPGWKGTHFGSALIAAAEQFRSEALSGNAPARRELVLISDGQEGGRLDGLQGFDWPAGLKVSLESVRTAAGNAGVTTAEVRRNTDDALLAVRVTNARDSAQEQLRLSLKTEPASAGEPISSYVPPGQMRSVSLTALSQGTRSVQVELNGDPHAFDNTAYLVIPDPERFRIAWLGVEAANDPAQLRYYFERVFPETERRKVEVAALGNNAALTAEMLRDSTFAVIPRSLNASEAQVVRGWLSGGHTALLVLADEKMASTLMSLSGVAEARLTEASGANFALLAEIDFNHPLFAPFADPRFSDFTRIHFWKHRRLELPPGDAMRTLAKFDDGSPALVQFNVGQGSLFVLTAGWNPTDSQLAVASKFPPLMQTMLALSGAGTPARAQFQTGDPIPSPAGVANEVSWRLPDGQVKSLAKGTPFTQTDRPGFYAAVYDGLERRFAVNLAADESRTAPMSIDELARMGVPLQAGPEITALQRQESARNLQRAELESRQKLWRWLIAAALVVLLGELILSGRLARGQQNSPVMGTGATPEPLREEVA